MKILITGATGAIGGRLAKSLIEDGNDVRALVRSSSNLAELEHLDIEVIRGDLSDPDAIAKAVRGCHKVYHLGGQMLASGVSRRRYFSANVDGTRNIVDACSKVDLDRMVYASSAGVYGLIREPPVSENSVVNPSSAYRESKWLGEESVRRAVAVEKLPAVVVRIPGVVGRGSTTWLGLIRAIATGRFRIIGQGNNHDHAADVLDIVDGLRLCGETPGIDGRCYLIAGQEAVTVNEVVGTIARELELDTEGPPRNLPIKPYRVWNALGEMVYRTFGFELPGIHRYAIFLADKILDISKARRDLGFQPKVSFEESMRQTINWYREMGFI